jgi:hypothetical protein
LPSETLTSIFQEVKQLCSELEEHFNKSLDSAFRILTGSFNIVPDFIKPTIFMVLIQFCGEHNMLPLISPQLESIDAIAERFKFSEKERNQIYEKSIQVLSKGMKIPEISRILFKVLLQFVKKQETTVENVILLYVLSIQLLNVSQFNKLIEMPAYKILKDVFISIKL